ncbi:FF domain-containing protein [Sarocladium implicatum]|nr:FF domain-containing protein [Sarocladium implicatum]
MLKSTYKPAATPATQSPLPPGWSEHTAPTGHKYYYNENTKESTYRRPESLPLPPPQTQQPSLADPRVANAYLAQFRQSTDPSAQNRRGPNDGKPRPAPKDRPKRKEAIPGCEPWILVYTKYSRRFVYNPEKNTSYWRIPEKLMPGILELDQARIRSKGTQNDANSKDTASAPTKSKDAKEGPSEPSTLQGHDYDSSEYEEVEVTDDEDAEEGEDGMEGSSSKRQKTGEEAHGGPVEFTEADIAMQLQAMNEAYGLDDGEYEGGDDQEWPDDGEEEGFSEEDAKLLFKDLLIDLGINPYSPWEKLMEDGVIVDDPRYTALTTTKARKECWSEWSRERIAELKEQRARQEKKDPKIAYMALLQEKATPKLYWPEFKRKYKKEAPMKDLHITDKDREKAYREHINRLKLPQSTLKSDLTTLLKAQPVHLLNNKSSPNNLPPAVLTDLRYISLNPSVRDPLIAAYVQTLPAPPEDPNAAQEDEEARKASEARRRREKALQARDRQVDEQQRQRDRALAASKARLRDEERELESAMKVGKRGLQSQLADMRMQDAPAEKAEE